MHAISTGYGVLVPQYEDSTVRRKYINSVTYYSNGNIKSIALHEQTMIPTPIGILPAELLTFYENGKLKRLFPLNGKITAYWTEENEYALAVELDFFFKFGNFRKKVIAIYFYESGSVKGLTFWPNDSVSVESPLGEVDARIGLTLYPNGRLKSFEPNKPLAVKTPIGEIIAYNPQAIGINGDRNSCNFYEDGSIKSLATANSLITVTDQNRNQEKWGPSFSPSLLENNKTETTPLWLEFNGDYVRIGDPVMKQYEIDKHTFIINHLPTLVCSSCSDCSVCNTGG